MAKERDVFVGGVEAFIAAHDLLCDESVVVAAVSGGADSVAMASALRSTGRYRVHVAHVHHNLRGADADGDAEFVRDMAEGWGLPFSLERIDTPALARGWGVGIEEAARRGRYDILASVAGRVGADAVAVAHHADDQVETVLHRIVRGTHLRGLCGMAPRRPLAEGVRLVRPLLWARRAEVEDYCRRQELPWRTDHTNRQTEMTRNFIRHELLGLLRERLNPRTDEAVLRLASAAGEAQAALEDMAGRVFERACGRQRADQIILRAAPLKKAHPLVAAMALRRALAAIGAPEQSLGQDRFRELLGLLTGDPVAVDLPGGIRAEAQGRSIRISRRAPASGGH